MLATSIRLAGKSADHTLYHAHPKVSFEALGKVTARGPASVDRGREEFGQGVDGDSRA